MHVIENKNLIRAFNLDTMEPASGWYENNPYGVGKLLHDLKKWKRGSDGKFRNITLGMFKSFGSLTVEKLTFDWGYELIRVHTYLCFQSNQTGFIPLKNVPGIKYDYRNYEYYLEQKYVYSDTYNRNKALRQKDSGFRKDPVSWTGRYYGKWGRKIHYKGTHLAYTDPECAEYNIKGYRTRRVLDNWDIEPYEKCSKSWKENTKARKQWDKHKKPDDYSSMERFTREYIMKGA